MLHLVILSSAAVTQLGRAEDRGQTGRTMNQTLLAEAQKIDCPSLGTYPFGALIEPRQAHPRPPSEAGYLPQHTVGPQKEGGLLQKNQPF